MPRHPAAHINVIAEEGTKDEAVLYLQKTWDELCELRAIGRRLLAADERGQGLPWQEAMADLAAALGSGNCNTPEPGLGGSDPLVPAAPEKRDSDG
jgi:hypothetical protein